MSAREWRAWRPGVPDVTTTGSDHEGAMVYLGEQTGSPGRWVAKAWGRPGRMIEERGFQSQDEAQRAASEWLDRREAEGRGEPAVPDAFVIGAMETGHIDEMTAKIRSLAPGESLAFLVTRRDDGLARVVWGPAKPTGTPASSGEPAAKPEPKPAEEVNAAPSPGASEP